MGPSIPPLKDRELSSFRDIGEDSYYWNSKLRNRGPCWCGWLEGVRRVQRSRTLGYRLETLLSGALNFFHQLKEGDTPRMKDFSSGLYLAVDPPKGMSDWMLDPLLPKICRGCFIGDLCERYENEVLPSYIAQCGSDGFFAARTWYRKQIVTAIIQLLWYRFKTLLFTEAAWQPPEFRNQTFSTSRKW